MAFTKKSEKQELKETLLASLKKLQVNHDEKFVIAAAGNPFGIFRTKEDVEAVINYIDNPIMIQVYPIKEYESGEIFTALIESKLNTLH